MAEKKPQSLPTVGPLQGYWTKEQAAEFLGLTPRAVQDKAYRRELPFYKLGRQYRFKPAELEEWMRQKRREAKL